MGIQFGGFDDFGEQLDKIAKMGTVRRNQFVAQEAEMILGKAKDNTPVDTGHLRDDGWKRTRASQGSVTIYNNVEYAAHVEYGHRVKNRRGRFVPGKKMLHRAMLQSSRTFRDDAKQIMENIFGHD